MTYPFTNSMVLQRNQVVPIWGVASSGEVVSVTFNGQTKSVTTPSNGKWRITLDPMIQNGPLTMTIQGNNTITFTDVYIGEVWNCAGQSNMDTRLSYYSNYADTITKANNPLLRYIDVRYSIMGSNKGWHSITPSTAGGCSATAYFFGNQIQKKLGCAVGLLVTAVGGTYVEQWLDPATIAANPGMVLPSGTTAGDEYNQFIAPVLTYGIKGTICMHGEQNAGDTVTAPLYGERFKALIKGWRDAWGQGDFPFYYGQITMYNSKAAPDTLSPIVQVREGQRSALVVPNTGMTVNIDLSSGGWHFPNKYEAGRRLSLFALANDYGETSLEYSGPVYQKMGIQGSKIKLQFSHIGTGLKSSNNSSLAGFIIAGENNVWYNANALIVDSSVVVSSSSVTAPVKVAYVLGKTSCNLSNSEGLPASPFNTYKDYFTDGKNQVISMAETNILTFGAPDFSPASTSSGLKITYESDNPNVATITSEGLVHLVGIGICKIRAYQKGDSTYRPSIVLAQTLNVSKGRQSITFEDIPTKTYGDAPFELSATGGGSEMPVTYSVTSGDAVSINGNVVTILKAGSVTIKASQTGNVNYYPATAVSKSFDINKGVLTVTAVDTTKNTDTDNPEFRLSYTGFIGTDNEDSIDVKPVASCTADKSSPVGEYVITPSGGSDNNYTFDYLNGKLIVKVASGLDDIKDQFSIYPVPVKNHLIIDMFEPVSKITVIVEGVNGQKLIEKTENNLSKIDLNFSGLNPDVFILKIYKNSQLLVTRVLKQ